MSMVTLREHRYTFRSGRITLRPLTGQDWNLLYPWYNDPDVLYYADGNDASGYSLEEIQEIFRGEDPLTKFCFIIEYDGVPIGECWLQRMNLEHLLRRFPGLDCRRIDLAIGEKAYWGQGIGTEVIHLLTRFGFEEEGADLIFGCGIADYNPRSRRAFEKNGYVFFLAYPEPEGGKAKMCNDLALTRRRYAAGAASFSVTIERVLDEGRPVLSNLMELYQHDFSEYSGRDVDERGLFGSPALDGYWTQEGHHPFFIRVDGTLGGFALVRQTEGVNRIVIFFVLRKYRRRGIGRMVAGLLFDLFPGRWRVEHDARNVPAAQFWRSVINEYTGGNCQEVGDEKRLVEEFEAPAPFPEN